MERALALPAPAKINLFLHVLGRRADGYHELQTVFALIDLADWIDLERRDDGKLQRTGDLIGPADNDLALRAARLLQQRTGTRFGADIQVLKRIPAGAGLGGGSSDAATTLIALNRLWNTGLDRTAAGRAGAGTGRRCPVLRARFQCLCRGTRRAIESDCAAGRPLRADLASSSCFDKGNLRRPRFDTKYQSHENVRLFCGGRVVAPRRWAGAPTPHRFSSGPTISRLSHGAGFRTSIESQRTLRGSARRE